MLNRSDQQGLIFLPGSSGGNNVGRSAKVSKDNDG